MGKPDNHGGRTQRDKPNRKDIGICRSSRYTK